jgi:hypothetical protein
VEQHDVQRVTRVLQADQIRQRERDPLGRSEPVFAVQNHAVAEVEHHDRGTGALVFALHDHQVVVFDAKGKGDRHLFPGRRKGKGACPLFPLPHHCVQNRPRRIEVHGVAELVLLRRAAGFDARRHFAGVVTADAAPADRAEQIPQRPIAEKVEALVRDLESEILLLPARPTAWPIALGPAGV